MSTRVKYDYSKVNTFTAVNVSRVNTASCVFNASSEPQCFTHTLHVLSSVRCVIQDIVFSPGDARPKVKHVVGVANSTPPSRSR